MPDASVVQAARAGDARALDALVGAYLPLVYNIVGRALDAPADVDDVVQDVMLEMVRDLRQLRDPDAFRSWLVAIAMRRVRGHWRQRRAEPGRAALEEAAAADPGADFVDLTIAALGLSDQRREVAQATRWLDEEDRHLLALWWLEAAGQLTRAELAAAMDSTPPQVAVLVHRTKARLDTARAVVRALQAVPTCPDLAEVCLDWDGKPSGLWRKRIARHVRECPSCSALHLDLVPAESLLVGLPLVPVPFALLSVPYVPPAARAGGAGHGRALTRGRGIRHWTALPTAGKAAVAGVAALGLIAGVTGVKYAADHNSTSGARSPLTATSSAAPLNTESLSPSTAAPSASPTKTSASASPSPSQAAAGIVNTAFPIRAAFYYPWYPENFQPPGSHYTPTAGHYSVDDPATVDRQIKDMQYAGLQAGIESWWGQGTREDKRLPLLMAEAAKLGFSWSA